MHNKKKRGALHAFNLDYERLPSEKFHGLLTKGTVAIRKANSLALRASGTSFAGLRSAISGGVQQVQRLGMVRINKRLRAVENTLEKPLLYAPDELEEYVRYILRDELAKAKGRGKKKK